MSRAPLIPATVACVAALAAAGCGGAANIGRPPAAVAKPGPTATPPPKRTRGYPSSIAVLGHSGATGEDSDPAQPHVEIRTNSWATGTNPRVNSVYQRILAKNPAVRGHNVNLAHAGATVDDLLGQAQQAVALRPRPDLVLVQIMDNDMVCPAARGDYASFRARLVEALRTLAGGLPGAHVFLVSQFGMPMTEWPTFTLGQRKAFGGTGPCDYLNRAGKVVPSRLRRLTRIIRGYEAQLQAGCARVPRCRYDDGAFARQIHRRGYVSEDLNHFSVAGHAKAAAVAWAALRHAGLVP
jgi:GDSL-like Lipase/Acylhydrolase family